jgi:hypothetical protein
MINRAKNWFTGNICKLDKPLNQTDQEKNTRKTQILRAGRVAQVVECQHSKCEALNSSPSTKRKNKERKTQI